MYEQALLPDPVAMIPSTSRLKTGSGCSRNDTASSTGVLPFHADKRSPRCSSDSGTYA